MSLYQENRTFRLTVAPTSGGGGTLGVVETIAGTRFIDMNPWQPGDVLDVAQTSDFRGIVNSYGGTARIRQPGHEGLIAWGGGHLTYGSCEAYRFDLATMTWVRIGYPVGTKYGKPLYYSSADPDNATQNNYTCDPTYAEYYNTPNTLTVYGGATITDSAGTTGVYGPPSANHSYHSNVWVPPGTVLGNDPKGYLYNPTTMRMVNSQKGGAGYIHYLGMSNNPNGHYWMRGPLWPSIGGPRGPAIYDELRKRVVRLPANNTGDNSTAALWHSLDGAHSFGSGTLRNATNTANYTVLEPYYGHGHRMVADDLYIIMPGVRNRQRLVIIDPANSYRCYEIVISPMWPTPPAIGALEWIEASRKLVWWHGQDGGRTLHVLTAPSDPRTGTWAYSTVTVPDGDTPQSDTGASHGPWGRLTYWPTYDKWTWLGNANFDLQTFRVAL